jgi:hypothetical protein
VFRPPFDPSLALGVGNRKFSSSVRLHPLDLFPLQGRGVGDNEYPPATMRGTNGRCRYAVPLSIKPERGQVSENSSESPNSESIDVFHEHNSRSYLANDPRKL